MIPVLILASIVLVALVASQMNKKSVMPWVGAAWAIAWTVVAFKQQDLWPVALLGFLQNIAFTFVSRGRNSGSLGYHFIAAIFSNGLYAALLFSAIDQVSQAKANPGNFLVVYTLATLSGSIFAHWLAMKLEKGKAKVVNDNSLDYLRRRIAQLESEMRMVTVTNNTILAAGRNTGPITEGYREVTLGDGTVLRFWLPDEDSDISSLIDRLEANAALTCKESSADLARRLGTESGANAVQVTRGGMGVVFYREWP